MVMMLQTLLCRAIKLVTTMVLPTVRATVDNFCLQRKETGAAAVSPRACFLWPPRSISQAGQTPQLPYDTPQACVAV